MKHLRKPMIPHVSSKTLALLHGGSDEYVCVYIYFVLFIYIYITYFMYLLLYMCAFNVYTKYFKIYTYMCVWSVLLPVTVTSNSG